MAAAPSAPPAPPLTCLAPPALPALIPRRWGPLVGGDAAAAEGVASFSVLQWNVMADAFSSPSNYTRVPASGAATDWPLRRERILGEIRRFDPDIVTLQEVDHYHDCLEPRMAALGYRGAFMQKPLNQDGSATFVRASKFDVLSVNSFNYWDERPLVGDGNGEEESAVERVPSNQVALSVLLRLKGAAAGGERSPQGRAGKRARLGEVPLELLVVNTHLRAAKTAEGEKMRARQAQQLMAKIQAQRDAYMAARYEEEEKIVLPVLLCGDFNARPPPLEGQEAEEEYPPEAVPIVLRAPAGFRSCYNLEDPALYTTWKFRPAGGKGKGQQQQEKEIKHCIDYIFLASTGDRVRLTHRLSIPTAAEVGTDGLPCVAYPSDHLALGVRFAVRGGGDGAGGREG